MMEVIIVIMEYSYGEQTVVLDLLTDGNEGGNNTFRLSSAHQSRAYAQQVGTYHS